MVPPRQTLSVPHLGGIDVGYRLSSSSLDHSKPTLVLIIPFTTTVDYYVPEFENKAITDRLNLLAVEPLGHGATQTKSETFTYWDTAIMALQLLQALGIERAFAMGTSQGGWIAARMALLAPQKVCAASYPSTISFLFTDRISQPDPRTPARGHVHGL
jgi:pimeloyl-ACP methyl ester carboxylesterase